MRLYRLYRLLAPADLEYPARQYYQLRRSHLVVLLRQYRPLRPVFLVCLAGLAAPSILLDRSDPAGLELYYQRQLRLSDLADRLAPLDQLGLFRPAVLADPLGLQ